MRSALSLAVLSAFTVSTLPVHAFPGASVNLVRVSADGVRALPGLDHAQSSPQPAALPSQTLISQVQGNDEEQSDVTYLLSGDEDFEIRYASPLPENLSGTISIRRRSTSASEGTNGEEVESIPLNSPKVTISEDRLTLTIKHDRALQDGETLCALLPEGPYPLPQRLTPCCFKLAKAATSMGRKTSPCGFIAPPTSNQFPWWIIPVGLGLGVGICAAAGCFNSGGGGGGSNNVSQ